eukprot:TRINITY_DN1088_c0_g2_i1.p1 TRINITY_DN1088_c0_g2~~TRINITY_DN1088_c0_g2_i1.p1  ORF type:complete len:487 (+),score=147.49 TRINITY_DN1088_c0_g2_i1:73-1461(+)
MASAAGYQIAREKYQAQASQASLQADIRRQEVMQAELQRAQHTQQALESQIARSQAEAETRIAQERLRFYESDFAQSKVHILLQGFQAVSSIFHNISWTAALIMGATAQMFLKEKVDDTGLALTYTFWAVGLLTLVMLVHSIFVASLSLTDATKLAYQGTRGIDDIRRAFHGLMKRRGEVFWNFVAGFCCFNCLVLLTVWAKLDAREGIGSHIGQSSAIYGASVTAGYLLIPAMRMYCSFRSIREEFEVKQKGDSVVTDFRRQGRTGAELTEADLVPDEVIQEARTKGAGRRPRERQGSITLAQAAAAAQPAAAGGHQPPEEEEDDPADLFQEGDAPDAADPDYAPAEDASAALPAGFETRSAEPEALPREQWTPDRHTTQCTSCSRQFTTMRRKHHCRLCGNIYCNDCCKNQMLMQRPGGKGKAMQRVCDECLSGARRTYAVQEGPLLGEDMSSVAGSLRS